MRRLELDWLFVWPATGYAALCVATLSSVYSRANITRAVGGIGFALRSRALLSRLKLSCPNAISSIQVRRMALTYTATKHSVATFWEAYADISAAIRGRNKGQIL